MIVSFGTGFAGKESADTIPCNGDPRITVAPKVNSPVLEMEGRVSGEMAEMGDNRWDVGSGVRLLFRGPKSEERREEVLPFLLEAAWEDASVSVQSSYPVSSEVDLLDFLREDSRSRLLRCLWISNCRMDSLSEPFARALW